MGIYTICAYVHTYNKGPHARTHTALQDVSCFSYPSKLHINSFGENKLFSPTRTLHEKCFKNTLNIFQYLTY